MYKEFYNLSENPFGETPDTRFFYKSRGQAAAFEGILEMIEQDQGFALVTGEIGTGKTLFGRMLLSSCEKVANTAIILNPELEGKDLVRSINQELKSTPASEDSLPAEVATLSAQLIKNMQNKMGTLVFIDEAQNLSLSALETLRLLSNIECESRKLIQIILCGQPELKIHLEQPQLRQLNQRISQEIELLPLAEDELSNYLKCRIEVAGGSNFFRFDDSAIEQIYKLTRGAPRLVNILCHKVLKVSFQKKSRVANAAIIREAASHLSHFKPRRWYEWVLEL